MSRQLYTVSRLTAELKKLLEEKFEHLWVEGEISNFRGAASGHLYFTLKDAGAQIRGVMFRLQTRLLKFQPADGLHVVCYGRLSLYEARGEYQFIADYMEPKGLGALQLAFEQLKEKLAGEGLFDPARKRPLPLLPQCIGVITSPSGAAIRDILQIINRRYANVCIQLYPVRVQGPGAALEIAQAIDEMGARPAVEVIIVGRGGGSLEDLWAFNEEAVARAIFRSRVPVISAVGHEIDFTISDFVADVRASTPSAAAELVVRNKIELIQSLESLSRRLTLAGRGALEGRRSQIAALLHRLADPRRRLADHRMRVGDLSFRLGQAARRGLARRAERLALKTESLLHLHPGRRLAEQSQRLAQLCRRLVIAGRVVLRHWRQEAEAASGKLMSLSPLAVLERGYSIVYRLPTDEIVRDATRLKPQDEVRVKVHRGSFTARVESAADEGQEPGRTDS